MFILGGGAVLFPRQQKAAEPGDWLDELLCDLVDQVDALATRESRHHLLRGDRVPAIARVHFSLALSRFCITADLARIETPGALDGIFCAFELPEVSRFIIVEIDLCDFPRLLQRVGIPRSIKNPFDLIDYRIVPSTPARVEVVRRS